MLRTEKILKTIGLILIFLGIILNPFVIEKIASDGDIEYMGFIVFILIVEIVLITIGSILFLTSKFLLEKKMEVLLFIFVSIFCVVFADIFLGIYVITLDWHSPSTQFDSELGWAPIKDRTISVEGKIVTTNSLGYRSKEVNLSKKHIFLIGDSVAWGSGVSDNQTMAYYLNEKFYDKQVLNLAVSGYGIDQYYIHLINELNKIQPEDIIVLIFSGNDGYNTVKNVYYGKSKPLFKIQDGKLLKTNTPISRSSCHNFLSNSFFINRFFSEMKTAICKEEVLNNKEGTEVIKGLLREIELISQEYNSSLTYVLSPHKEDYTNKSEDLEYFQDLLSNYSYIDIYEEFEKKNLTNEEIQNIYIRNAHYSPNGNYQVSELIYRKLYNK